MSLMKRINYLSDKKFEHGEYNVHTSASKSSIRRFVITEKAPTFNQDKALVGAFSVITNIRMELFWCNKPSSARLCSAQDPAPGVWVVSGPRRHQEAAGIHGEAGQWGSSILTSESWWIHNIKY